MIETIREQLSSLPMSSAEHVRVSLFPSDKPIPSELQSQIIRECHSFLQQWDAHGKRLDAGATVILDHFLCIGINESHQQPTGCSLDKLSHFVQSLEKRFDLHLNARDKVYMLYDGRFTTIPFSQCHQLDIQERDKIFNLMCATRSDMESSFLIPIKESPYYRLFY
jgi:hypothetical protein